MSIRGRLLTLPAVHPGRTLTDLVPRVRVSGYWLALAGLAAVYLALAAWLPPLDDELYYWCWSQELQLSYFDHPPMTAYLIRASTELFGPSLFATRLPACLSTLTVLGVVGWLTRPRHLLPWVTFTPLFTFGAVLVTPDTPLLLFWSLYLGWMVLAHERLSGAGRVPVWMWLVGGVLLGCDGLGKYTSVLAVPAGFVSFALAGRPWRDWLPGYVGHGAVSFVMVLPVLAFNVQHDFAPLRFQWEHAMSAGAGEGLWPLGEFVGCQILLFGLLPLALFPWVVWHFRSLSADPRLRVCASLYAVPLGFFLYKAVRGPLEGNWALACYVGFWPVAARWYEQACGSPRWRWATVGSFAVPAGCVVLLAVHLVTPLGLLRPKQDRVTRQTVKWDITREAAEAIRRQPEQLPVYAVSYQDTAWLRFFGVEARQIDGATRPSNFTLRPDRLADVDRAYFFGEGPLPVELAPGFGLPEVVATFPMVVRGETFTRYHLMRYTRVTSTGPDCR